MLKLILKFYKKHSLLVFMTLACGLIGYIMNSYAWGLFLGLLKGAELSFKSFSLYASIYLGLLAFFSISYGVFLKKLANEAFISRLNKSKALGQKLLSSPYENFEKPEFQRLASRSQYFFAGDSIGYQALIMDGLGVIMQGFLFIYSLVFISIKAPILVLPILLIQALIYPLAKSISDYELEIDKDETEETIKKEYLSSLSSDFRYGKDIRIFALSGLVISAYKRSSKILFGLLRIKSKKLKLLAVLEGLLCLLSNAAALFVLASKLKKGSLSLAEMLLCFSFYQLFIVALQEGMRYYFSCRTNSKLYEKNMSLIEKNELTSIESYSDAPVKIELKNVSFKYPSSDENVLKNIYLSFMSNEKLGLIGENGAGKSTLIKLITGFFEPSEGEILVDGKRLSGEERSKYFSGFFQSSELFPASVCENIFGTDKVSKVDAERARAFLKKAGLESEKITLDTRLNKAFYKDAWTPSGGQKQMLLLIRALISQRSMCVIDEPASALDSIHEEALYKILHDDSENRGFLLISHRLSVSSAMQRTIVLNKGRISSIGTHEELMKASPEYRHLREISESFYRLDEEKAVEDDENA